MDPVATTLDESWLVKRLTVSRDMGVGSKVGSPLLPDSIILPDGGKIPDIAVPPKVSGNRGNEPVLATAPDTTTPPGCEKMSEPVARPVAWFREVPVGKYPVIRNGGWLGLREKALRVPPKAPSESMLAGEQTTIMACPSMIKRNSMFGAKEVLVRNRRFNTARDVAIQENRIRMVLRTFVFWDFNCIYKW